MLTSTDLRGGLYVQKTDDFILDDGVVGKDEAAAGTGVDKKYVLRISDLPQEEKPREKLIKYGPAALSVGDLLAILLNAGTRKEGVLAMSRRLLKEYGENALVSQKDPKKVQAALGIPLVKACQLVAAFELGRRFLKAPAAGRPLALRTASQVFDYLKDMRDLPKEHLRGLYLDSHYQLVHDELISVGSVTANIIHPREVFRPALEHSASAVILAHNHPSGVLKPSEADIATTRQIVEAGKIMGIGVLDHVIITKTRFASIPAEY